MSNANTPKAPLSPAERQRRYRARRNASRDVQPPTPTHDPSRPLRASLSAAYYEALAAKTALSVQEAADYLDISVNCLGEHKADGPPSFTIGRVRKYRRTDLDAWMAARVGK